MGRQQIPVGYGHAPEHNPARIDLQDAPQPGHGGPEMALDVVMDAVGATVAGRDSHEHGLNCWHTAVKCDGHPDYLHDGHLLG